MNGKIILAAVAIIGTNAVAQTAPWSQPKGDWAYDGRRILGHLGNDICLWDAKTGKLIHKLVGHGEMIFAVRFSPNGKQAVTSSWLPPNEVGIPSKDTSTILWDLDKGKQIRRYDHQVAGTFSQDGNRLVLFNAGGTFRGSFDASVWDVPNDRHIVTARLDRYLTPQYGGQLQFSTNGNEISYSDQGRVMVYDATDGHEVGRKGFQPIALQVYAFPPDGAVIWSLHEVHVYDIEAQKILRSFPAKTEDWISNSCSPDGQTIVGTGEAKVEALNLESGKLVEISECGPYPRHIVMSPDSKRFLIEWGGSNGLDPGAGLYDIKAGKQIAEIKMTTWGRLLGFAPDAKTFLVGGKTFAIYDAKTGKLIRELNLLGTLDSFAWTNSG